MQRTQTLESSTLSWNAVPLRADILQLPLLEPEESAFERRNGGWVTLVSFPASETPMSMIFPPAVIYYPRIYTGFVSQVNTHIVNSLGGLSLPANLRAFRTCSFIIICSVSDVWGMVLAFVQNKYSFQLRISIFTLQFIHSGSPWPPKEWNSQNPGS